MSPGVDEDDISVLRYASLCPVRVEKTGVRMRRALNNPQPRLDSSEGD
jgi:hypothetical protein